MRVIRINKSNIDLLLKFISVIGSSGSSFRYFNSRSAEVICNHVATLIGTDDAGIPVCYGHLDRENDTVWLGICVSEGHTGQGLGKEMMTALVNAGDEAGISEIKLSVDKDNLPAIRLYEKNGFRFISGNDKISFYLRTAEPKK